MNLGLRACVELARHNLTVYFNLAGNWFIVTIENNKVLVNSGNDTEWYCSLCPLCINLFIFEGEVHDFYKTLWFVEFKALSLMVKVWGSCDKPFKRYSRLKNLLCEHPQGTNWGRYWAIEKLSKCADSCHFTFFHFVLIVMYLHFGVALDILAGEKQATKVNLGEKLSFGSSARADGGSMTSRGVRGGVVWPSHLVNFNREYHLNGLSHEPWTFTVRLSASNCTNHEVL